MEQYCEINNRVVLILLNKNFNEDFESSKMTLLNYRNTHPERCEVVSTDDDSLMPGERDKVFFSHKHFCIAFKSRLSENIIPSTANQSQEGGAR